MTKRENPRTEIDKLIENEDLQNLLEKTGELHGHFCPYVSLGVRAGVIGIKILGVKNTGMEEVLAIVECNNCFTDGVQFVSGCSFGNNGLIFRDIGKTAVTFTRRDGKGIRISVKFSDDFLKDKYPEHMKLFEKVVVKREGTEEENKKLRKLWAEISFNMLKEDAETLFKVEEVDVEVPEYAPIFGNIRCSVCGERIMETRGRFKDRKPICLSCASLEDYVMDGRGIHSEKF